MFFLLVQLTFSYKYKEYYIGSQYFVNRKSLYDIDLTFKNTRLIDGVNWTDLYFNKSSKYFHALYYPGQKIYVAFRLPTNNDKMNYTECNLLFNSFDGTEDSFFNIIKQIYEIHNLTYNYSDSNESTVYMFELSYDLSNPNRELLNINGVSFDGEKCKIKGVRQEVSLSPKYFLIFYALYLVFINGSWLFYFLNRFDLLTTVEMFWDIFMTFGESLFPTFIYLDKDMSTNWYTKYIRFIYIFDIINQQLKQYVIFTNCVKISDQVVMFKRSSSSITFRTREKSIKFYVYYISFSALFLFIHYGLNLMISTFPLFITLIYNSCYLLQVFVYLFLSNDCDFLNQNEFIILNLIGRVLILFGRAISYTSDDNYYWRAVRFTIIFLVAQAAFIIIKNFIFTNANNLFTETLWYNKFVSIKMR